MMLQARVLRFFLRAVPKKSNPKYYEWETASICIFVTGSDRDAAEAKVRRELEKRHWTLIRIENLDVLIDARVREEGGEVLRAYEEALRGRIFFKAWLDGLGGDGKSRQLLLPARINEDFMDKVIVRAGGERVDTSQLGSGIRNADYLLGRYIFELKDLQEDGMEKGPHQAKLAKIFERYARGESSVSLNPAVLTKSDFLEYLNILGRPIQGHVRSASKQIKETKKFLGREDLFGGLILINTGFGSYPHEMFAEQVERYAKKDTKEFSSVVTVSMWSQTNGFDTVANFKISPEVTTEPEVLALQEAFDACYMSMMTDMVRGGLSTETTNAPPVGAIGFNVGGIDFSWEPPAIPLPWKRED
ncbi:hypothetical protein [Duganella radicis]|uniref:Uncharacterized protein n=1 Tax=Duganella radicis TaxID=551988 RepID=A0A6L6PK35_9BURK|nr:hypothetical protein [Duganella radicis]MTV39334.1 hypothetical protein [Duganella radicis]